MRRFLIRDGVTRDAVEAELEALGWECLEVEPEVSEVVGYRSAWLAPDRSGVASYMENTPFGCSYVFTSDAVHGPLAEAFAAAGLLLDAADLLAEPLVEGPLALRTIGRMGLLAHGPVDVALLARLTATLIHPGASSQRYAIYALSNTGWSAFEAVLDEALEAGAFAPPLHEFAASMLASLRAAAWNRALYDE